MNNSDSDSAASTASTIIAMKGNEVENQFTPQDRRFAWVISGSGKSVALVSYEDAQTILNTLDMGAVPNEILLKYFPDENRVNIIAELTKIRNRIRTIYE